MGSPPFFTLDVRYPEVAAELENKWGHLGTMRPKRGLFVMRKLPKDPIPALPKDFLAYLRGKREDYAQPYLASLKGTAPAP